MRWSFPAKTRRQSGSMVVTIPAELVSKLNIKEGEIYLFSISDSLDSDDKNEDK